MTEDTKPKELEQVVEDVDELDEDTEKIPEGYKLARGPFWHKDGFYRSYPPGLYYDARTGHYRVGPSYGGLPRVAIRKGGR